LTLHGDVDVDSILDVARFDARRSGTRVKVKVEVNDGVYVYVAVQRQG